MAAEWGRAAKAVIGAMWERDALVDASAMAFSLFLASIPLLGLVGMLMAWVLRGEPRVLAMLSSTLDVTPDEVHSLVDRHMTRGRSHTVAPAFLGGSLWLGATAFQSAMTAFEIALGVERRSWVRKRLIALGCVIALLALLVAAGFGIVLLAGGPLAFVFTVAERGQKIVPRFVTVTAGSFAAWIVVAAFFRVAVRHREKNPVILPGAAATVIIGMAASYCFTVYAKSLARYSVFYGSLAAVAVFLIWLWLCCTALLLGVELNAYLAKGPRLETGQ